MQVLLISRVPRTLALILSGSALAVAGLLMQMLARNRFVEPGTAGTVELDAATVMQTHCLEPGRTYRVQAVLVGGAQAGVSADVRSNPVMLTMNAPP